MRNFLLLCTCQMYTFSGFLFARVGCTQFSIFCTCQMYAFLIFFVYVRYTHFYIFPALVRFKHFLYLFTRVKCAHFLFFSRTCQMYTIFYFYLHESSYVRILKKNLFAPFRCRHFSIFSRVK